MLSLENITIQILYGLIAVTISFLAIVNQAGVKQLIPRITSSPKPQAEKPRRSRTLTSIERTHARSRPKSRGKTAVHSSRIRKAQRRLRSKSRGSSIVQPIGVTSDPPSVLATVQDTVPSCPTCGLQAPHDLMMEHFQASPSHELGTPEPSPTIVDDIIPAKSILVSSEEDSKNSMRNLLQMLVPPRAFGRRHQNRTVNPLSHVIRTLEESRSGVVHPL